MDNDPARRLDGLPDAVFETDAEGRLVFLNPAWRRVTGYPEDACLGRPLHDFILDSDWLALDRAVANAASANAERPVVRLRRPDGSVSWMELSLAPLGPGVIGVLRDATPQRAERDAVARPALVAIHTDAMVTVTDGDGRAEWVNDAFSRRTGYTREDLTGLRPDELLRGPDTNRETVAQIERAIREGTSFQGDLLNYTKEGEAYWVRCQMSPVRDAYGHVERFAWIQSDATEWHHALETLETARARAESANEAKTRVLATLSHEIRTPINVILGETELALEIDGTPPSVRAHITRISDSSQMLQRLVTNMLDVAKIEAGQIDVEEVPVDVRTCLQNAVAPIADRARAKGLDFRVMCDESLPTFVLGDPDRLGQIITTLAENAVTFTAAGFVRVEVSRIDQMPSHGAGLEIRVVDSGVGISGEALAHLSERFAHGDAPEAPRQPGAGAGLGLSILKSLVGALGGTVSVFSRAGEGADFRVTLPLSAASQPASPAGRPQPSAMRPSSGKEPTAHVLVAEDNDANFAVLEIYLSRGGYAVERALDGRGAVVAASRSDLILMDLEMPHMDGLEATRRIRAAERERGTTPVPIIALTAHALQEYRGRCLAAGCTGYLSKPVRMQGLLEAVVTALKGVRGADKAEVREDVTAADPAFAHLLPGFLQYCQQERTRLLDAADSENWAESARLVGHTIKGTGPSLGLHATGPIGGEIEGAGQTNDRERLFRALAALETYTSRVEAAPSADSASPVTDQA